MKKIRCSNNILILQDGSEDMKDLVRGNRTFNPFILFVPAMCDMIGTSVMYVGLNLTFASSFQMFRGTNKFHKTKTSRN